MGIVNRTILSRVVLATTLFASLGAVACGGPLQYQLQGTPLATGADAKVVADVDKKKNQTQLKVEVSNLAPPGRVAEDATTFILWQRRGSDDHWARIGTLDYDEAGRKGAFEGSVPEADFDLQIGAERDSKGAAPAGKIVFEKHIGK